MSDRVFTVPLNAKTVADLLPVMTRMLEELQYLRQRVKEQETALNELKQRT